MAMGVAGRGPAAVRRFSTLQSGGAKAPLLFSDEPGGLGAPHEAVVCPRLPNRADLTALRALWIAGLPEYEAAQLAALAHSVRVLVNVEDQPALCDFHSVAEVRRGDLLLTVSTGGASPGLAARLRARLAAEYGPEWAGRVALLGARRAAWRRQGADVPARTDALLRSTGWLA